MEAGNINIGVYLAHSSTADTEALHRFIGRLVQDTEPELSAASGMAWHFHIGEAIQLESNDARRPADFLDTASLRMAEGTFDAVIVVTDLALISSSERVVPGLASPLAHVAVISTRRLGGGARTKPVYPLDSDAVRWNGAALLLHLIGHLLGLGHGGGAEGAMSPFRFDAERRRLPSFRSGGALRKHASAFPDAEYHPQRWWQSLALYVMVALRHPLRVCMPILRNRAPLLPLKMPSLATAAVAPTILLVFTAEIWDTGLDMTSFVAWTYALISIIGATLYLVLSQNLLLPGGEKHVITEHLAVVNLSIMLTMLLATVGLFILVAVLMLFLETYVFPPGLIATWPTLKHPEVTWVDKFRLAVFISTIGVTTGALAGGLESRNVIRHMALFLREP